MLPLEKFKMIYIYIYTQIDSFLLMFKFVLINKYFVF